jgi:chaperonin GroEL (HSP60 family)
MCLLLKLYILFEFCAPTLRVSMVYDPIGDLYYRGYFLFISAKTSMSSKIIGSESNFFSELAVTAALKVKIDKDGKSKCPISNIHILKSHGLSALNSELVDGFALNCSRASVAMPTSLRNAKVALLDFNLQKYKLQMGVQVVVTDTKQVFFCAAVAIVLYCCSRVEKF